MYKLSFDSVVEKNKQYLEMRHAQCLSERLSDSVVLTPSFFCYKMFTSFTDPASVKSTEVVTSLSFRDALQVGESFVFAKFISQYQTIIEY